MLSSEENEILCRVGPGTPMGALLRRYWLPAVLSSEVPAADCPPVRVRLLSEDLVAFRDTSGRVGLLANACAHRGASLFFGRNEEDGLRCVYHGWKYDIAGRCIDMPSEPAESNFRHKVQMRAYPTHESGGVVWTYMGPPERIVPFRDFGSEALPRQLWQTSKVISYCNFVQSMEGNIDTAHISFLHSNLADVDIADDGHDEPGYPTGRTTMRVALFDRAPRIEIEETPYGFRYAGLRTTPNGHQHARVTDFAMPIMSFVSSMPLGSRCLMMVPIDEHTCWRWSIAMHPSVPMPGDSYDDFFSSSRPPAAAMPMTVPGLQGRPQTADNDYLIDREKQKTYSFSGIGGINQQDLAVTESMGPIYDRTREHLGTTDLAIIHMRRMLLKAATDLQKGIEPLGLDPTIQLSEIRSAERILEMGQDWRELGTRHDEILLKVTAALAPIARV